MSSSNIKKDKYIQQNMDNDGYISIELFLGFNKLKQLKVTLSKLQQAVSKSRELILSSDKLYIKRKSPVSQDDYNADIERTLYVEGYNVKEMNHDILRKLFTPFGKVLHVSMPRFANHSFRGFAFIEFSTPEAAVAAKSIRDLNTWLKKDWLAIRDATLSQHPSSARKNTRLYIPNLVIKLQNVPPSMTRNEIKDLVSTPFARVSYVDDTCLNQQNVVYIRYLSRTYASNALCNFKNGEIIATLLGGIEEETYWNNI